MTPAAEIAAAAIAAAATAPQAQPATSAPVEVSASGVETYQAPRPAPSAFKAEPEPVRTLPPRETIPVEAVPTGPGFAPAVPPKIEWPSDLQQVESDPDKVRAAEQEGVEEQPAPRPKRVRPPQAPAIEEPLVQIETGQPETTAAGAEQNTTTLPG